MLSYRALLTTATISLCALRIYLGMENHALREEIIQLQQSARTVQLSRAAEKERPLVIAPESHKILAALPSPPPSIKPLERASQKEDAAPLSLEASQWLASERVKSLDEVMVLSEGEKESLADFFKKYPTEKIDSSSTRKALGEILGTSRAEELTRKQAAQAQQEEADQIEQALSTLQRKIGLSTDQAPTVRAIIATINAETKQQREELQSAMEDVTARHNDPKSDRSSLRDKFLAMQSIAQEVKKTRAQLYQDRFKGVLTDEQYNALLAMEPSTLP